MQVLVFTEDVALVEEGVVRRGVAQKQHRLDDVLEGVFMNTGMSWMINQHRQTDVSSRLEKKVMFWSKQVGITLSLIPQRVKGRALPPASNKV